MPRLRIPQKCLGDKLEKDTSATPQRLIVLLVGDELTTGVNLRHFRNRTRAAIKPQLLNLGATFPGSARFFRRLIQQEGRPGGDAAAD
jgi:hypothetical protein